MKKSKILIKKFKMKNEKILIKKFKINIYMFFLWSNILFDIFFKF